MTSCCSNCKWSRKMLDVCMNPDSNTYETASLTEVRNCVLHEERTDSVEKLGRYITEHADEITPKFEYTVDGSFRISTEVSNFEPLMLEVGYRKFVI